MTHEVTREAHVRWCIDRALEYVDRGEFDLALASMMSDLGKHPDTGRHPGLLMGFILRMHGHLETPEQMREFLNGFH